MDYLYYHHISYIYYKRIKREDKITIYHCANIYFILSIYSTILESIHIRTILGDLYEESFNSSWCLFPGYLSLILLCMMCMTFVNQAFYRLVRIVYGQYRWLQHFRFYMILPFIELICACTLMCRFIPWDGVVYFNNDYFCYVSMTNIPAVLWAAFVVYIIPFMCILIIYIRITIFIRQQRNNQVLAMTQRQARDLLIMRRIFVIVSLLLILGIPAMSLIVMFIITGKEYPLTVRISFFPVAISTAGLSVALPFSIPQLNAIVRKLWQSNNVIPLTGSLAYSTQMKTVGNID